MDGTKASADMLLSLPRRERVHIQRMKLEGSENPLGVGQGANDLARGCWPFPHERWHRQDLSALRALRVLHQIDDVDAVTAGKVLFAKLLNIAKGGDRFGSGPRDVEPQL